MEEFADRMARMMERRECMLKLMCPGGAAQDAGMAAEFGCVNPEICPAATDGDPDGPVPPGFPQIAGVGKETVRHAMGSGAASRHRAALSAGEKDVLGVYSCSTSFVS